MPEDTIAAIATSVGSGGIGIVKISGPAAMRVADEIFRWPASRDQNTPLTQVFSSHRLYRGHIYDPKGSETLDEVLLCIMRAPRSYTREDVVEIQSHGGAVVLTMILQLVLKHGARLAEPGEFTRRAFINGRLDLSQAEAVIDIIQAKTDRARGDCCLRTGAHDTRRSSAGHSWEPKCRQVKPDESISGQAL